MRTNLQLLLSLIFHFTFAQNPIVHKIEPPNWWTGMKLNNIQLMVYGENLGGVHASSSSLKILKTYSTPNPSYVFLDMQIPKGLKPGTYAVKLHSAAGSVSFSFPVRKRPASANTHQGFDPSDVIYLITPDRFANGDTTNDNAAGMLDSLKPAEPYGRHGGDIQGVINKLDYLRELGVTALWLNPVIENNMNGASYHGYAVTDMYKIDSRFGSNELYSTLVAEAHKRQLKIIMDHVNNHIGINHPWIKNPPTRDWLNGTVGNHQKVFHSKVELDDVHSDSLTKRKAADGWFTNNMPDLNQGNPFVARYLIQNTIWWIESAGIDGIREDTYPYIDPGFRERWCKEIMDEYPRFNIVGEVWIQDPVYLAPYQRGARFTRGVAPQLPSVTDFGLFDAFMKTFADSTGKIENIFDCLTKDFLFSDANNLVTFLDNHDIRRIMYNVNGDVARFKLSLVTLLTTRGIPEILYGTEIGMKGGPDHGRIRSDFPGGFSSDAHDAFTQAGRTEQEEDIFNFTKQLLHIRKKYKPLQTGELIHFKPENEVYVYFRISKNEKIMVVINHNKDKQGVNLLPFEHQLNNVVRLREVMTGKEFDLSQKKEVELDGMNAGIFEIVAESQ